MLVGNVDNYKGRLKAPPPPYLRTIQNILMASLASSQVSDDCPFGYLFFFLNFGIELQKILCDNKCVIVLV